MKKKILALLLTVVMAAGLLPGAAFAADMAFADDENVLLTAPAEPEDGAGADAPTSGTCGNGLTWDLTDGVLTISGTGAMDDYEITEEGPLPPWFVSNFGIEAVVVEEGVTYIGTSAFDNTAAATASVPASVTSIGKSAFGFCYNLTDIKIAGGNTSYVFENGVLFSADKTVLHTYLATNGAESYIIPDSVTTVAHSAFAGCMNLTSVTIPEGVTAIDGNTFGVCLKLAEVTIPAGVTSIGDAAFFMCGLTDINYGGTMEQWAGTSVGADNEALAGATIHCTDGDIPPKTPTSGACGDGLTWDLTGGVLTISGTGAMDDYEFETAPMPWVDLLSEIKAVVVEEGVTYIGTSAFDSTAATTVTVPASVTSIGKSAFGWCLNLTDIKIANGNTSYVFENGVLFSAGKTVLHTYLASNSSETYIIPDTVTAIEHSAFAGCMNLTGVTIPAGVTAIDVYTFGGCLNLAEVTIPAGVASIGVSAFAFCSKLADVYYGGAMSQWKELSIGADNEALSNAAIHCTDGVITPAEPEIEFSDVPADEYYAAAVNWAVENKYTVGTSDTEFSPEDTCTHIQILTFLWRAAGRHTAPQAQITIDPGYHQDYHSAVNWAYEKGMIGSGFDPEAPCTRADTVKYLWQADGSKTGTPDQGFTDVTGDEDYAEAVNWAAANGITKGDDSIDTFNPTGTCTRGQIVTFLHRVHVPEVRDYR